ncbi:hypothetical protein KRR40_36190 [Niabella defluvii]|nr:hypothetical protein KRR40_36190 [Niabella sp. I65]
MAKVKIGMVQMSCTADKQENLNKAIEKTKEAAAKGAQIVACRSCLPRYIFVTLRTTVIFPGRVYSGSLH